MKKMKYIFFLQFKIEGFKTVYFGQSIENIEKIFFVQPYAKGALRVPKTGRKIQLQ
jgi:hypothetical protein